MIRFLVSRNKLWLLGFSVVIFSVVAILLFSINRESKKGASSEKILMNNRYYAP